MNGFRGVSNTYTEMKISGTQYQYTATKDCWLTAIAAVDTGITIAPVLDIGGAALGTIARGVGMTIAGTAVISSTYLRSGTSVTITAYRCTLDTLKIFTGGGNT